MNPENTKKLYEKYPKIFGQKELSPRESLMCFGFECGDGWYWLIDELCSCIQGYMINLKDQIEATQVKEKFGTLRFYTNYHDETVGGMIWFAENMSYSICEACGSTKDVTQTQGWVKTRCKKCMEEKDGN